MRTTAALAACLFAASASPALAQGDDEELGELLKRNMALEQEVTTATRSARKAGRVPATVVVVTDEDIAARGYTDLEQVLHDLPGFDFSRGHGDEWSTIYMRGYRSNNSDHFIFMVDGIIENDLWKSNAFVGPHYPLADVKRVEVTYGAASALYGANASQGIIHVITKTAEELGAGQGSVAAGSLGTGIVDAAVGSQAGGVDVTVAGRGFTQAGRTDLAGNPAFDYADPNPAYQAIRPGMDNQKRGGLLRFKVGAGGWTFGGSTWRRQDAPGFWYNDRFTASNSGANWTPAMSHVYGRHRTRLSDAVTWQSLLQYRYHQIDGGSFSLDYDEAAQAWSKTYYHALSKEFWANQQLEATLGPRLDVIGGLDLANGDFQGNYALAPTPFPQGGETYDITRAAAYGQGTWTPLDPLQLTIGGRYDYRIVRHLPAYGGVGGVFSPRLGAVWTPDEMWTVKALYATGFTDPDNFTLFATSAARRLHAADLRPERLQGGELALGQKLSETLQHEAAAYYNHYWDTILQQQVPDPSRPGTLTGQFRNVGGRQIPGLEYRLSWTPWPGLKAWANYTWANPRDDQGIPSGDIAPHKGNLGLAGHQAGCRGSLRANLVGPRPTVASNPVREVAGYAVLHGSVGRADVGVKGLGLDLIVNNLLDTPHEDPGVRTGTGVYASTLPQNGRTFMLRASYGF